ncbi:phosphotransferase family protein [Thalassovita mangrovi]|uniref:Phosphotransferase n=1 Tax=Thalassovita mangrovi TaxID=2692236 RepID=A0A6L8LHZ8_9RHOB|nr:aminoglycoside phosphotransferase family protein [Thalassovita mangrovi]MYM55455.1 phosphotransferase [Thalassovita mangrovi]
MHPPPQDLVALLAQRHAMPALAGWVALPGGQTNRAWRVQVDGGSWVVKLFARQDDNPLFPNSASDEARMLRLLAPGGLAPRLIDEVETPHGSCLIYEHAEGAPWQDDPALAARALARLHRQEAPEGLRRLEGGSASLSAEIERIIGLLPAPEQKRLLALRPEGLVPPARALALLHGDPVPGNMIVNGAQVTLIDWQCPGVGDPVEDLAIFLSPAMQLIYRGRPLSEAERAAFLDAYGDPNIRKRIAALAPWHHWRMAAYCAWKAAQDCAEYEAAEALEIAALTA